MSRTISFVGADKGTGRYDQTSLAGHSELVQDRVQQRGIRGTEQSDSGSESSSPGLSDKRELHSHDLSDRKEAGSELTHIKQRGAFDELAREAASSRGNALCLTHYALRQTLTAKRGLRAPSL